MALARMADVARVAGVSSSTVSYALSGKRPISAATRARIDAAISELEYTPHAGARALAMAKTSVIGLLAPLRPGVDIHVLMEFVSGITATAHEHEYDILLVTQGDLEGLRRVASKSKVDGLIVMDVEVNDPRLEVLEHSGVPAVLVGRPDGPTSLASVDFDFAGAGRVAARYLAENGHTSVAAFASPKAVLERETAYAVRLRDGFEQECAALGVRCSYLNAEHSGAAVERSVKKLLCGEDPPTGFFIHNESAMPGILAALQANERSVPDDVAVVALSPESMLGSTAVPLTSIPFPAEAMGQAAMQMLLDDRSDPGEALSGSVVFEAAILD